MTFPNEDILISIMKKMQECITLYDEYCLENGEAIPLMATVEDTYYMKICHKKDWPSFPEE